MNLVRFYTRRMSVWNLSIAFQNTLQKIQKLNFFSELSIKQNVKYWETFSAGLHQLHLGSLLN